MSYPVRPIFLFADSQLLFHTDADGRAVLSAVREEMDSEAPKAAYIGASNGDDPTYFSIFEAAMDLIGIADRRMIFADYNEEDRAYLAEADLILLAGGDVGLGWRAIEEMQQDIIGRYYAGAVLVGVSAGAVHLGLGGSTKEMPQGHDDVVETFKLIPFYVDAHDEDNGWERLRTIVMHKDPQLRGLGIPKGGGLVYHPDHTLEPLRQSLVEIAHVPVEGEEKPAEPQLVQNILLPGSGKTEPVEEG